MSAATAGGGARKARPLQAQEARRALERLARRHGVALGYRDVAGRRHEASDPALVAVLAALGEPLERAADAPGALAAADDRRRRQRHLGGGPPPLLLAWDGHPPPLPGRLLPGDAASRGGPRRLTLRAEDGGEVALLASSEGALLRLQGPLPLGHHQLLLGDRLLARVLAAPSRPLAGDPARGAPGSQAGGWALFAPTYALRDRRGRPAGDLTALGRLGELAAGLGATALATLPLLAEPATAEGAPPGQQPYAPLSRLWWNEAYLDPARLPELDPHDRAALAAAGPAGPVPGLPATPGDSGLSLADLAGTATALRPALERAARRLAERRGGARARAFAAYRAAHPDLQRYCAFRAALEVRPHRAGWPPSWRAGDLPLARLPEAAIARHAYAQFATDALLAETAARLGRSSCGLLLDLPVGCRPDGYDPWAHPGAFAAGASVGAPPDAFFAAGQDWGFPPLHPQGDRAAGYPLLRRVLAHNAAHAGRLRIDHALGWWRLWWVPAGRPASEGAYVRYPTEELLAVACLEAQRRGVQLVGEDLGTVPPGLRPALARHGVEGMRVAVFDLATAPSRRLAPPPGTVAYLDTHDTATFPAFLTGADARLRASLGIASRAAASREQAERRQAVRRLTARLLREGRLAPGEEADPLAVHRALLEELGASRADLVVVTLEDLLGEEDPQNVPGTTERPNFARRCSSTLEQLAGDPRVLGPLRRLEAARRRAGASGEATALGNLPPGKGRPT